MCWKHEWGRLVEYGMIAYNGKIFCQFYQYYLRSNYINCCCGPHLIFNELVAVVNRGVHLPWIDPK